MKLTTLYPDQPLVSTFGSIEFSVEGTLLSTSYCGMGHRKDTSSSSSACKSLWSCCLNMKPAYPGAVTLLQVLVAAPQPLPQLCPLRSCLASEGVVGWAVMKKVFTGVWGPVPKGQSSVLEIMWRLRVRRR